MLHVETFGRIEPRSRGGRAWRRGKRRRKGGRRRRRRKQEMGGAQEEEEGGYIFIHIDISTYK